MSDYSVAIVVDREFGERLLPLTQRRHIWICDTPANAEAVKKAMAAIAPSAVWNEVGVTTFRVNKHDSPEDIVLDHLRAVDLHHGEYSHDPAWTVMEIYGAKPTSSLRQALQEYGVNEFHEKPGGFVCSRPGEEEQNSVIH